MSDVVNNRAQARYELEADGRTAYASYRLEDGKIAFTHTVVPPELEGRGIGSRLVKGALDDAGAQGLTVKPLCAFVRHYIETHAEYRHLAEPSQE